MAPIPSLSPSSEGNRLLAAGMFRDAVAAYESALKVDPKDVRCLLGLGKAHNALGAPDEAIKAFDAVLAIKPDHTEAKSHRGVVLVAKGDPSGPAELEAAASDRRSGFEEHLNFGIYLVTQKQDDRAMKEFDACTRIESRDARPYTAMGAIASRRGDHMAAINHLTKATQFAGPKDSSPFVGLARAYFTGKQAGQAAAAYLQALQRRSEDDALVEEAYTACVASGELDTAFKVVMAAREKHPTEAKYSKWQEEVMARLKTRGAKKIAVTTFDAGDATSVDAEKELEKANELLNRNPPSSPQICQEAMKHLDRVLQLKPKHGQALVLLGLCQYLTGQRDTAFATAKKATEAAEAAGNKLWKEEADFLILKMKAKDAKKAAAAKTAKK